MNERFPTSTERTASPEEKKLIQMLQENLDNAIQFASTNDIPQEILQSHRMQEAVKKGLLNSLQWGNIDNAKKIIEVLKVSDEVILSDEVQKVVKDGLLNSLLWGNINNAKKIIEEFQVSDEVVQPYEMQEAIKKGLAERLSKFHGINAVKHIIEMLQVFKGVVQVSDEVVQKAIKEGLVNCLSQGGLYTANNIIEVLQVSDEVVQEAILAFLSLENLHKIPNTSQSKDFYTKYILDAYWEYIDVCSVSENIRVKMHLVEKQDLPPNAILKRVSTPSLETEKEYEELFNLISSIPSSVWNQSGHTISTTFKNGAECFGWKKMFQYIHGENEHDKLFAFEKIIALQEQSGLPPHIFYANILAQVQQDNTEYQNGPAYQKLNEIAQALAEIDLHKTLMGSKQYDIEKMQALIESIEEHGAYTSWKMLKQVYDLHTILNQEEILEQLQSLPSEDHRLKKFIETLAFHPSIDTGAVIEFWRNPASFLAMEDEHSEEETHEFKKPSNYTDIPYTILTPEALRDALIYQSLDKIQQWEPLEIVYTQPKGRYKNDTLEQLLFKALGSRKEKIKGEAKNPGVLYKHLNDYAQSQDLNLKDILSGAATLTPHQYEECISILTNTDYGLAIPTDVYRVKIGLKSDPDVLVAGNDTACCMPFGSGKNNVYMYNPSCGQLVVQKQTGDDTWRTVAQSVVTKDRDIRKNIADIVSQHTFGGDTSIADMIDDSVFHNNPDIMVCDNIEVAPNFKDGDTLEKLYTDFFAQYAQQFGKQESLDTSRVLIGTGQADALFGNPIDNTFLPNVPVAYSDNTEAEVYEVQLANHSDNPRFFSQKVTIQPREKLTSSSTQNVSPLTSADTLTVAFIEGKIYAENKSLQENLHNMENLLIATDITNAHENKTPLSFKYEDAEGKTTGYIIAYEGVYEGSSVVYIADCAALPESKLARGRLMKQFLQTYKESYVDTGNPVPILTHSREKTSYAILKKQFDSLEKTTGISFTLKERGTQKVGGDTMYEVLITPNT